MTRGEVSIAIDAPVDRVWDLISDPTRTGEWSPECVSVSWVGDVQSAVPGARFVGHNKQGSREWDMHGVVDVVTTGREFAFHTERNGEERTRWGYRLTAADQGTVLVEWWDRVGETPWLVRMIERILLGGRQRHNEANVRTSLQRIKAIAEA